MMIDASKNLTAKIPSIEEGLEGKRYSDVPMCLSSSIMNCTNLARLATEEHPMAAVVEAKPAPSQAGDYPESDGQPMAENTKQFEWIVTIKENLDALLTNAFVAGDLFWYPLEGNNRIRQAPVVLVVFGRPKGHRGSYRQWGETTSPRRSSLKCCPQETASWRC